MLRSLMTATIFVAYLCGAADAASIGFTNRAAFDVAIATFQDPDSVDFDSALPGALIPSGTAFDGITFTYTIDTHTLRVTDAFGTTSPFNSLGLDTADDAFIGGDAFDMTFDRSVNALGLYVIGESIALGDLTLTIGTGGSVSNGAADSAVSDGGDVFFLGVIDTTDFTTANLSSFAEFYPFNVDDIYTALAPPPGSENTVPEPTTLALCAAGAFGIAVWRRRRALTLAIALMLGGTLPAPANAACLVGEVVFWGGDFVPAGWLPLDGTLRSRGDFPELGNLIAFRYGPPPIGFFRLPDLGARTPLGTGQGTGLANRTLGTEGGTETVTLTPQQLPAHSHPAIASDNVATSTDPHGNLWAAQSRTPLFGSGATLAPMHPSTITTVGGDQPHPNMSPFLTLTPIICATGPAPEEW